MPQLRQLRLQGNALVTLPPLMTFHLPNHVEVVSLTGNPLRCDCDIEWLWHLAANNSNSSSSSSSSIEWHLPECHLPEQFRGVALFRLPAAFCRNDTRPETTPIGVDIDPRGASVHVSIRVGSPSTNR